MPQSVLDHPAPSQAVHPAIAEEYHLAGEAVRALVANQATVRPHAGGGPQSASIWSFVDPRQWRVPSAYLLLSDPDPKGRRAVYVGGTGDLLQRLATHERTDWTVVVALTGHGLLTGEAKQLERGLGRVLMRADPKQLQFTKAWSQHDSLKRAEVPMALVGPVIVLADRVLRHRKLLSLDLGPSDFFK